MAMIKCPECGQEISDKAKKCVHCGMKIKGKNNKILIIIMVVLLIVILGSMYFIIHNKEDKKDTQKKNQDETETNDIIKEQEDKYERYVDIAINNTKKQLKHPDSINLNKVIVLYKIENDELITVDVAIDFSSENNMGTAPRGYSISSASPQAVDDKNYMSTYVSNNDEYYVSYYNAVTEKGYLKDAFKQKADEYYEGVLDGETWGYFNYDVDDIEY
ncbi:MAG: zinc ribbon domain-containing protein [Lachnospiraceae bacterium]|nr:zinc ribbon domain-containing protein [Lachnospiraceae bacterium]